MNVKHTGALNDVSNFETFFQSFTLLFQLMTAAGWDGILSGLMNEKDCEPPNSDLGTPGDCGYPVTGIVFIVCYVVVTYIIIINLITAVILENYYQAIEDD